MAQAPNVATGSGSVPTAKPAKNKGKGNHRSGPPARVTHVNPPAPNPYDLTAGGTDLSPAAVRAAVQGAANVKYNPSIQTTKQNISASNQRSRTDIPAWYQSYIDALNHGRGLAQQDYANAAAGATAGNPTPTGDATLDAAAQIRGAMQNTYADTFRGQGANTLANIDANLVPQASLMQAGSLGQESRNHQNLVQQLGQLQSEKGDYANTVLSGMRQQYQTFQSNEDAAAAAAAATNSRLNLARDKFRFQKNQSLNKRDPSTGLTYGEETGMTRTDLLAAGHDWQHALHPGKPAGPEKPYSSGAFAGKTPSWVRTHPQQSANLVTAYRNQSGSHGPTANQVRTNQNAWDSAYNYFNSNARSNPGVADVQADENTPYDIAAAAYDYWHNGRLTPAEKKALQKLGIAVPVVGNQH